MCTFCCTTCQKKIKEHGSLVDCEVFGLDYPMIENTTKLYDKSFLCSGYVHKEKISKQAIQTCKSKMVFRYKYDALRNAWKIHKKENKILRPYKCEVCGKWHLTTFRGVLEYNPTEEFLKAKNAQKFYD